MSESYTGACLAVQSTMQSCASRIDSLRGECTKSYGTLTDWPGSCECTYYAQDLMCFDEQELCASQAWSQVPAWFREGVTSCLAKDENYTVRAQLGTYSDPFTVVGLAGSLATTTANANGTATSSTAGPGATISGPSSSAAGTINADSATMTGGVIAGITIGSVVGLGLITTGAYLFRRRRNLKLALAQKNKKSVGEFHELHSHPALHESDNRPLYEKHGTDVSELPQQEPAELFAEHAIEIDSTERDQSK
ncbi:hypothetical protein MBLNU13_g05899t1 [Cladosporium sp. NU13]